VKPNGGMMSYRLAGEAADVFRAVASVARTAAMADRRPSRPSRAALGISFFALSSTFQLRLLADRITI
jgi:poly(3-hydroxybutyrate) depolymerase